MRTGAAMIPMRFVDRARRRGRAISRRLFILGLAALPTLRTAAAAFEGGDVDVSAEDLAWFRRCRSVWVDCESGAPAVFPGDMSADDYMHEFDSKASAVVARMEKVLCAVFLHAAFGPGVYRFALPVEGRSEFTVTLEHIKLLKNTNWKTAAIDCKRPYGDYTNFEIDMARALGLPVTSDPHGDDAIAPDVNERMDGLHKEMQFVLQAYVEHADLSPGRWFICYDGWDYPVSPRCVAVPARRVLAYKSAMAAIAASGLSNVDKVVPRLKANSVLFETAGD